MSSNLVVVAIWNFRHNKAVFFFFFLYLINYLPTSNLLLNIGSIMAERFMYLPLIAFAGILVITVDAVLRKLYVPLDDDVASSSSSSGAAPVATVGSTVGDRAPLPAWHDAARAWRDAARARLAPVRARAAALRAASAEAHARALFPPQAGSVPRGVYPSAWLAGSPPVQR